MEEEGLKFLLKGNIISSLLMLFVGNNLDLIDEAIVIVCILWILHLFFCIVHYIRHTYE